MMNDNCYPVQKNNDSLQWLHLVNIVDDDRNNLHDIVFWDGVLYYQEKNSVYGVLMNGVGKWNKEVWQFSIRNPISYVGRDDDDDIKEAGYDDDDTFDYNCDCKGKGTGN